MIPATSVLALASFRYSEWKQFLILQNTYEDTFAKAELCLPDSNTCITVTAEKFLRNNALLFLEVSKDDPKKEKMKFQYIVERIWNGMCAGEDLCCSETSGRWRTEEGFLLGYDLNEAVCFLPIHLRKLKVSENMETWAPLQMASKTVHMIFCNNSGSIMSCGCNQTSGLKIHEALPLKGYLQCMLEDLHTLFGEEWPLAYSRKRGLPIGKEHHWFPKRLFPHGSNASLQSIQSDQRASKKLQKKNPQTHPEQDAQDSLPKEAILLTFGKVED